MQKWLSKIALSGHTAVVVGVDSNPSFPFQFMFESENSNNVDILKEIAKGIKLRHVKTNDRSKPNLKGIVSNALF